MKKNEKIFIEFAGGLGAQIFSYALKLKFDSLGADVYSDTSYFNKEPIKAKLGYGVSIFPWELDYYGHSIDKLKKYKLGRIEKNLQRKLKFWRYKYIDGNYLTSSMAYDALNEVDENFFPIQEKHVNELRNIFESENDVGVVHIRRGDYLNVASKLVSDEEYISGCNLLIQMKCKRIILVSDDPIEFDFYRDKINKKISIEKYESDDIFLTHAVIRSAKYVITANSQYSMSAALLNKRAVILTPRFWLANNIIEHPFTKDCSWLLMNRRF